MLNARSPPAASGAPVATPLATPVADLLDTARQQAAQGRGAEAERLVRRVLRTAPAHSDALHLLAALCVRSDRLEEARGHLEALAAGCDGTPLHLRDLAEVYRRLGRHEDACRTARAGLARKPCDPAALLNLGIALADRLRLDEAVDCFERAIALAPGMANAHLGLGEALLARGEFGRGWEEYEWRFRMPGVPPPVPGTDRPQWDGSPLPQGRLLLVADQGYGDSIQFARYIPWATVRCGEAVLACSPALAPLLAQLWPGLEVRSSWDEVAPFAAWCPLSGLPRLAGTRLHDVPGATPYLRADAGLRARWAERLAALAPAGMRRVGLVWAGRAGHGNDRRRSMRFSDLAALGDVPGIVLVVLQKGPAQREAGRYWGRAPLVHLSAEVQDFSDTAAIIDCLDLVVTVDTSVAHLAGAMGRTVWLLLSWAAEWRWLLDRSDSPWYPSARLFRQPDAGAWQPVVAAVADRLARLAPPGTCDSRTETKLLGRTA